MYYGNKLLENLQIIDANVSDKSQTFILIKIVKVFLWFIFMKYSWYIILIIVIWFLLRKIMLIMFFTFYNYSYFLIIESYQKSGNSHLVFYHQLNRIIRKTLLNTDIHSFDKLQWAKNCVSNIKLTFFPFLFYYN